MALDLRQEVPCARRSTVRLVSCRGDWTRKNAAAYPPCALHAARYGRRRCTQYTSDSSRLRDGRIRPDVTYPGDPGGVGCDGLTRPDCPARPGAEIPIGSQRSPRQAGSSSREIGASSTSLRNGRRSSTTSQGDPVRRSTRADQLERARDSRDAMGRIEDLLELPGPWVYRASRTAPLVREPSAR
jgi:hypothetical protein